MCVCHMYIYACHIYITHTHTTRVLNSGLSFASSYITVLACFHPVRY